MVQYHLLQLQDRVKYPKQVKKTHDDEFSTMPQGTRGASIMGGKNEQAYLRSRNTNGRNISSVNTHKGVGRAKAVIEPDPNTAGSDESDANADTCCLVQNFIPIAYTNRSSNFYPYSEAYETIENVPIVSGATYYDHTDGNTYILVLYKSLYYVSKMKHSLVNPNYTDHSVPFIYENPARYEEFYVELYDKLKIPLQFKENKSNFLSRVPTRQELGTCQYFDVTSDSGWDPQSIDLNKILKISQARSIKCSVL